MTEEQQGREDLRRRAKELGVPFIEPFIEPLPDIQPDNPTVAICGQCGIEIKKVMGYVCMKKNCPCFPRLTC